MVEPEPAFVPGVAVPEPAVIWSVAAMTGERERSVTQHNSRATERFSLTNIIPF